MLTLRQRSMANSSIATRKSQWSLFERFCDSHSLVNLLCTKRTACLFIAELSRRHLEYNTVVSYVHSFTSLHHRHDHVGPDLQHFSVREALAGLQRSRRELPYQKHAITLHHLTSIASCIPSICSARQSEIYLIQCELVILYPTDSLSCSSANNFILLKLL